MTFSNTKSTSIQLVDFCITLKCCRSFVVIVSLDYPMTSHNSPELPTDTVSGTARYRTRHVLSLYRLRFVREDTEQVRLDLRRKIDWLPFFYWFVVMSFLSRSLERSLGFPSCKSQTVTSVCLGKISPSHCWFACRSLTL